MSALDVRAVLSEHEPYGGFQFCTCTPEIADGYREPLTTDWESHLAEVLTARIGEVLGGLREEVADRDPYGTVHPAADAALAVVREAFGVGDE